MSTSTSGLTVLTRMALLLGGPAPLTFTAAANATVTSVIAATGTSFGKTSATAYNGRWISVTFDAGAANAAPENESKVITAYSGTTFTVPAFSAAVTTNDTCIVTPLSLPDMYDSLNDVLRNLLLDRYIPATLLTDGDMETAGVTNWPDVTGSPTQSKETTASLVLTGTQSLKVIYTVVDTSVGQSLSVREGEQYIVWCPIKTGLGSVCVQAYDVQNSTVIYTSGTISATDGANWALAYFTFTAPANCNTVSIRLINKTASTTAYFDHVGVLRTDVNTLALPSQITDTSNLKGLAVVQLGQGAGVTDGYLWSGDFEEEPLYGTPRDYLAANSNKVTLDRPRYPTFYCFGQTNTAITTMPSVFYASTDLLEAIVEGAVANCCRKMSETAVDESQAGKLWGRYLSHTQTYRKLLHSLDLGQPKTSFVAQKRVYAGGRY